MERKKTADTDEKNTPPPPKLMPTRGNRFSLLETIRSIAARRKARFPSSPFKRKARLSIAPPAATAAAEGTRIPSPSAQVTPKQAAPSPQQHRHSLLGFLSSHPAPPKPEEVEEEGDSGEEDDSEDEGISPREGHNHGADGASPKKKKKKKKATRKSSTWVPKLLNLADAPKDRVYRHRKKRALASVDPKISAVRVLFTDPNELHISLLGKIMLFLPAHEPAKCCARVNRVLATAVHSFYEVICPHPRQQRFLASRKIFLLDSASNSATPFLAKAMTFLSVEDQVAASACSRPFYQTANACPLQLHGSIQARRWIAAFTPDRVHERFAATPALQLIDMRAQEAVDVVQLLDTDDDDCECFQSLSELSLERVHGFNPESLFVRFIQILFTDRVSHALQVLVLYDLNLEDVHFRHLARLFYDSRFPRLRRLSLARNEFSSRFMRDWSSSFSAERFLTLETLDVSDVGMSNEDMQRFMLCLKYTPMLQKLAIARNLCSIETLGILGNEIGHNCALRELTHLDCNAITADANAMSILMRAFSSTTLTEMRCVDIGGNPLSDAKACQLFADIFTYKHWPQLKSLSMAFSVLGESGARQLASIFLQCAPMQLEHIDLTGNHMSRAMREFTDCIRGQALPSLMHLGLADNALGPLEFEQLAVTLSEGFCPLLHTLDLSSNSCRAEGISRFNRFLLSPPARRLRSLDLSQNDISHRGLVSIAEVLSKGNCWQLHQLDLTRNLELRSVVVFQEMIRSFACPSLACLQIKHAQTYVEGRAFIRDVLRRIPVEELRRRKQAKFEQIQAMKQQQGLENALRDNARCKRQCQLLREQYDFLENAADRALRRRKQIRKSTHLMIHQEIQQLKQERDDALLRQALSRITMAG